MSQKIKISNNITSLIKGFTEKYCSQCKSYDFCGSQPHPPKGERLALTA